MKDMWKILGLEPTEDTAAIKRAYAQKARTCHPEEDPEGFLALRNAYQAALRWAETGGEEPPDEAPDLPDTDADSGWDLTGAPRRAGRPSKPSWPSTPGSSGKTQPSGWTTSPPPPSWTPPGTAASPYCSWSRWTAWRGSSRSPENS